MDPGRAPDALGRKNRRSENCVGVAMPLEPICNVELHRRRFASSAGQGMRDRRPGSQTCSCLCVRWCGGDGSRFRNPDRHHPGAPACRRPDPDRQSRARSRAGEDCQGGIDGACNFNMATFSVHAARVRRVGSALSSAARAFHVRSNRPERISARKVMIAWPPSLLRRMQGPSNPFVTVLLFTASSTPLPIGRLRSFRGPIAHA